MDKFPNVVAHQTARGIKGEVILIEMCDYREVSNQ